MKPLVSLQQRLVFDSTAIYAICIQGSLDERWSQRLGGLAIQVISQSDQARVTMLSGELQDQAALVGVLNTLYDLGLPLLSVECLDFLSTAEQRLKG